MNRSIFTLMSALFLTCSTALAGVDYATLSIRYETKLVQSHGIDDTAHYLWKSASSKFSGDLQKVAGAFNHPLKDTRSLTEFALIQFLVKQGWEIKAVESTPAYIAQVDSRKIYRDRTRVFHLTKITP